MRWRQDLQVKLRERYRRLYSTSTQGLAQELDLVVAWISSQTALTSCLQEARQMEQIPAVEPWLLGITRGHWEWPTKTEQGRAVFAWDLLLHISRSDKEMTQFLTSLAAGSNLGDMSREFSERIIQPLVDYLAEQVGDGSSVLYALERYVRQVEWFDRGRLFDDFSAARGAGEDVYDRHLREFLFREGFNMPFSQLKSPSGISDVLSDLDTEDPLVCEVKVYDGGGRRISHLASGVTQAVQYALDHGKRVAHLVIANVSGRPLVLPSDATGDVKPPYLDGPGVRVYLVQVRALPSKSASKLGKFEPVIVARSDLIGDGI